MTIRCILSINSHSSDVTSVGVFIATRDSYNKRFTGTFITDHSLHNICYLKATVICTFTLNFEFCTIITNNNNNNNSMPTQQLLRPHSIQNPALSASAATPLDTIQVQTVYLTRTNRSDIQYTHTSFDAVVFLA